MTRGSCSARARRTSRPRSRAGWRSGWRSRCHAPDASRLGLRAGRDARNGPRERTRPREPLETIEKRRCESARKRHDELGTKRMRPFTRDLRTSWTSSILSPHTTSSETTRNQSASGNRGETIRPTRRALRDAEQGRHRTRPSTPHVVFPSRRVRPASSSASRERERERESTLARDRMRSLLGLGSACRVEDGRYAMRYGERRIACSS
jgi:hypothetical protein